jgi:hypothetical protein
LCWGRIGTVQHMRPRFWEPQARFLVASLDAMYQLIKCFGQGSAVFWLCELHQRRKKIGARSILRTQDETIHPGAESFERPTSMFIPETGPFMRFNEHACQASYNRDAVLWTKTETEALFCSECQQLGSQAISAEFGWGTAHLLHHGWSKVGPLPVRSATRGTHFSGNWGDGELRAWDD